MTSYASPAAYLSHRPPMLLLSTVLSIEAESVRCETELGEKGPLAPFANDKGEVGTEFFVELMAQTIGVWAGDMNQQHPEATAAENPLADIGLLLSVRQAKFMVKAVPATGTLTIDMRKLLQEGQLATFEGEVYHGETLCAQGRITVYQPHQAELDALFSHG